MTNNKGESEVDQIQKDHAERENANSIKGISLVDKNIIDLAHKEFLFKNILPQELVDKYNEGEIYIHDKQLKNYCMSMPCRTIVMEGIPTLAKNMLTSESTKKVTMLIKHFSNTVVLLSQQVSGAVMLSQMTSVVASYVYYWDEIKKEPVDRNYLDEAMGSLFWELNMALRGGSQSPFTNITLEFGRPSDEIADEYVNVGKEIMDFKYSDIPAKYYDEIVNLVVKVMAKGTGTGIPFTFPLITVPVDDDFDYGNDSFLYLLDKLYKWGGIYLENFRTTPFMDEKYTSKNPKIKPRDPEVSRSMCCRLQIDLKMLSDLGGGIFGSSSGSTGAVQVLNLNMNRMLLKHLDGIIDLDGVPNVELYDEFIKAVAYNLELMQTGHQAKRAWIENNKEMYPTFFAYNQNLRNFFNVFAVTGMHEGLINIGFEGGMKNEEGQDLAHKIMQDIGDIIGEFILRDGVACGIEYAPAENAGVKMARNDIKWAKETLGRDIFTQGSGSNVFLTSGCMLPFSEGNFLEQVENASFFQAYATSGSILHHFLETKVDPPVLAMYIKKLLSKPIQYITLSPTLTTCMACGKELVAIDGRDVEHCPSCNSTDLAVFSRVIGYTRMISRGGIKVDEAGLYSGEHDFWSDPRRVDWNERLRVGNDEIKAVLNS